jgi:holliday junction DNA helicase RuvA
MVDGTGLWLELFGSPILLANIREWEKAEIWLHHTINDAWQTLFGFIDAWEKSLFRQLLKVSGIGGKSALNLLGLWWENLLKAIQFEDDILLSSVPWIGKKTAQKIIVDLKGSINFSQQRGKVAQRNTSDMTLISSLVQMGYDKKRVEDTLESIDNGLSLERRTIEAIKMLAK